MPGSSSAPPTLDLSGQTALVTGVGGLGFETALALARAGANVILAGRDERKGQTAVAALLRTVPGATATFGLVDLANLASVAAFSARVAAEHARLDILVNNAGVMAPPTRRLTADGFELQFGTNHLGHVALTSRLLPLLQRSRARVTSVSSLMHRRGRIHFDDLQFDRRYDAWAAYAQSKLAVLLFARELQRRSKAQGWNVTSTAAHPGVSRTMLVENGPASTRRWGLAVYRRLIEPWVSQSAAAGAQPLVVAATSPAARGSEYYGPQGFYEMTGPPGPARIAPQGLDNDAAARLWQRSEALVGHTFGQP